MNHNASNDRQMNNLKSKSKSKSNLPFALAAGFLVVIQACAPQPTGQVGSTRMSPDQHQQQAKRKVVFIAGPRSHGWGAHEHNAGSLLLAKLLTENHKGIETVVHQNGWPADPKALDGADAVVIYSNGGPSHPALPHLRELGALMDKGVGLVLLHYAVEVPTNNGGPEFLNWAGGFFETDWSVNPVWTMTSPTLPTHAITRGVRPYDINDEWYYHMRFREGMKSVQPILSALPPASSLERRDGPHENNPHVRAAVLERKEPQHMAWAAERPNGGRSFSFTGSHFHWNWGHPMQRRLVMNAIAWAARADVPANGIPVGVLTMDDLEANQDDTKPANFDPNRWQLLLDQWQREFK
jgi:hypothetical protein